MEEKGIFRSALGGFNKSDVLTYIDRLTAEWDQERQQLESQAFSDRELAQQSAEAARQSADEAEAARRELEDAREQIAAHQQLMTALQADNDTKARQLEQLPPLQEKAGILEKQASQLQNLLNEVRQQLAIVQQQLTETEEKEKIATAEMMAAEKRLEGKDEELAQRSEQLREMQDTMSRYEAVLGQSDSMECQVDGVVRPFLEDTNRRAGETLDTTCQVIEAMLQQLTELRESVEEKRRVQKENKTETDRRLDESVSGWMEKARAAAAEAATHATRFFR